MCPTSLTHRVLLAIALLLVNMLIACQAVVETEPDALTQPQTTAEAPAAESAPPTIAIPGAEPDVETPAGVVETFYTWYLAPQRSGDPAASPYLSQRLIDAVTRPSERRRLGADPFLLAQDVPGAIRVEEVMTGVATAQVVLHLYWNLDLDEGTRIDRTIDLVREGHAWKIDHIQSGSPLTPEGVVELFYNWYFQYGNPNRALGSISYALSSSGNPLADRAYRHSPYLAPKLVSHVDDVLAQFADAQASAVVYDPFLRARNHPLGFYVMIHDVQRAGPNARVPLQLAYGQQQTTVEVIVDQIDGRWQIIEVSGKLPDDAETASQVVSLFSGLYFQRWYAYVEEQRLVQAGEVDLASFLAEQEEMYSHSPFVSPTFAAVALGQIGQSEGLIDPFFQATALPATVEIDEAWADGDRAEVRGLQRWTQGHETRPLTVKLTRLGRRWLIDGALPVDAADVVGIDPRAEMHPADVVRAFFAGYLAQGGFAGGAHHDNDYLSPAYAESVESDAGYFQSIGIPVDEVDPILHSASSVVPDAVRVEVRAAAVDEEQHRAVVRADRVFANGTALPLTIMLSREWDNHWTILDIGAVGLDGVPEMGVDLGEAAWLGLQVASWYGWALAYRAQPDVVNELPSLLRFDMEAPGGVTYCTSSWPLGFAVESVFMESGADRGAQRARMVLRSSEPHALLVLELEQRDWRWAIVDQQCGDTPVGRAAAFYTAYLGAQLQGLRDRAYARGDYLTSDLIMALDDGEDGSGTEPLTGLGEAVRWFDVQSAPADNRALVSLSGVNGSAQRLELTFVLVDGRWLLSHVAAAG